MKNKKPFCISMGSSENGSEKVFFDIKSFSNSARNSLYIKKLTLHTIRRIIYILLTVAVYLIQFSFLPRSSFPFSLYLLIPVLVCVSMFEHEFSGLFYGLLTGVLWDLASPVTDGFLAFVFALFACITGLLSHYLLRNTLLNALLLTASGSLLYSVTAELFFSSGLSYSEFGDIFINFYFPSAALTTVLCIPIYFLIRKTAVKFRGEKTAN